MTRFHGLLASHSKLRPLVVPQPDHEPPPPPPQLSLFDQQVINAPAPAQMEATKPRFNGRHPWATLLRHVFAVDVSVCSSCQGRMRLDEICTTPEAIARAMAHA